MPGIALDALDETVNKTKSLVIVKFMFQQRKKANNKHDYKSI